MLLTLSNLESRDLEDRYLHNLGSCSPETGSTSLVVNEGSFSRQKEVASVNNDTVSLSALVRTDDPSLANRGELRLEPKDDRDVTPSRGS